jgi:glycine/D-amino acid oxidase-like deaminating enzyme
MNLSYWEKEFWYETYDYIIIGSGIVGLTAASELKRTLPQARIAVLERGTMPSGASTKNAGFACFGSVGEILDDLNTSTEKEVIDTIQARWSGLQRLKSLMEGFDIQYNHHGGEEIFISKEEHDYCYESLDYVNGLIEEAIEIKNVIVSQGSSIRKAYTRCLVNTLEAQLNPVLMIKALLTQLKRAGVEVLFNMEVDKYEKQENHYDVYINKNIIIKTRKLVLCTNAFTQDLYKSDDIVPARNQVLVTDKIPGLNIRKTYHYNKGYVYFRNIGSDRILIGGARHLDAENEQTTEFGSHTQIKNYLREFLSKYVLECEYSIACEWSGIIATGQSKKPIICKVDDGLYIAVRLGGMGVAIGSDVGNSVATVIFDDIL